jgi:transcriptional regulator of acetoin/glycerol metabolism
MPTPLMQAALDALGQGVVVFDNGGNLRYANPAARASIGDVDSLSVPSEDLVRRLKNQGARIETLRQGGVDLGEAAYLPGSNGVARTLAEQERRSIVETLDATGWKLTESARRLGISRTTLWRRLKAYGLRRETRGRWSPP